MENGYQKAINLITSQEKFHICLGLERVSKVLKLLGNPQENLKIIHVAGTNGKGSVCAMLSKILTTAGYKTGLYTSPHIVEYTERIKINQKNILKSDFAALIEEVSVLSKKHNIYLTEFELLTASAYKYFSDREADICVIETGLGGRLDATSAISTNLFSIITSISLDHTDRLGDTIEQIAYEKAGIIKEGMPVIVDTDNKGFDTIKKIAAEKNSKIIIPKTKVELYFDACKNYAFFDGDKYEFGMLGLWQKENLRLVVEAVKYLSSLGYDVSKNALKKALKDVFWTCRMQFVPKYNLLIDGTHNPDGARVLRESLDYYFPDKKRVWVYGALTTKDYKKVMETLFNPEDDEIFFYDFEYKNSVKYEELNNYMRSGKPLKQKALEYLVCENKNKLIIISGSFYMIGDILNSSSFFRNIAEVDNII
ncbi:MAG: bifunctional folylpolyglutamate synthase/dihydrofolate synthase [Clostridium sp.]|nr:bifunctional folylpolyglutamate synthase/dihydrofolate synthase [Clostridium sp.]